MIKSMDKEELKRQINSAIDKYNPDTDRNKFLLREITHAVYFSSLYGNDKDVSKHPYQSILGLDGKLVEIDSDMVELISIMWHKLSIETLNSCQDNPTGYVWIQFKDSLNAEMFIKAVFFDYKHTITMEECHASNYSHDDRSQIHTCATYPLFTNDSWQYKVNSVGYSKLRTETSYKLINELNISLRFPRDHLVFVVDQLKRYIKTDTI
jgi:hypothetical protein